MMHDRNDLLAGTHEDVSRARELELALRRSEARFRTLIDSSPDAVAVVGQGRFLYVNHRLVELLGVGDPSLLSGHLVLERVHPEDRDDFAEAIRQLLDSGGSLSLPLQELRLQRGDEQVLHVELAAVRLEYQGQPAVHLTLRDLSERRQLQDRLARSDRMASLGTLAAGVAHEINNPLGFVLMNLDGVLEGLPALLQRIAALREAMAARLGTFEAERILAGVGLPATIEPVDDLMVHTRDAFVGAQRVKDIVADLRTFARVEAEGTALGPVRVERALDVALNLATHHIKHRCRIRREIGPTPEALADEGRLSQVLLNLVVNAAQAPDGLEAKEVVLRAGVRDDRIVLEVSDNGGGIATEHLGRVFEPFFTTKAPGEGSGLGLAISREIVRGFGGELEVESVVGLGATFRVVLPLAPVDAEEVSEPAEEVTPASGPWRPRVLVVDDEPLMLRALERRLDREYDVTCVGSGELAVESLDQGGRWDMILCDVVMPGLDGAAVYRWVQSHRAELLGRLVFMTGGAVTRESRRFLEQTTNLVLPKPLDVRQLVGLMRGLMARDARAPASAK